MIPVRNLSKHGYSTKTILPTDLSVSYTNCITNGFGCVIYRMGRSVKRPTGQSSRHWPEYTDSLHALSDGTASDFYGLKLINLNGQGTFSVSAGRICGKLLWHAVKTLSALTRI